MFYLHKKSIALCGILLLLLLLAACGPDMANSISSAIGSTGRIAKGTPITPTIPITVTIPTIVVPTLVKGTLPGNGPIVITIPTSSTGRSNEQAILKDRILILDSTSKQSSTDRRSSLITLTLTIVNSSPRPIMNQSAFFQLMGAEGDIFTYQVTNSSSFYGPIAAHTLRNGTIVFQIPAAATSHLRLIYRSEVASETVMMVLTI